MNSRIDYPISKWEEMFYPAKLRQYLLEMPQVDDLGNLIQTRKNLLSETRRVVDHKDHSPDSWQFFQLLLLVFMFSLLPTYFGLYKPRSKHLHKISTIYLKYACALVGLVSSILGTAMLASWIWSSHLDLHHNVNLLLFWPTDILLSYWAISSSWRRKSLHQKKQGWLQPKYLYAHISSGFIHAFVTMFDLSHQDTSRVSLAIVPIMTLVLVIQTKLSKT